jgi:hypothetical protein
MTVFYNSDKALLREPSKIPNEYSVLQPGFVHIAVNNFWKMGLISEICIHKPKEMDSKIYTLLTIFIVYFLTAVSMAMFPGAQKVLTALLFGGMGIVLFLGGFLIWLLNQKSEE